MTDFTIFTNLFSYTRSEFIFIPRSFQEINVRKHVFLRLANVEQSLHDESNLRPSMLYYWATRSYGFMFSMHLLEKCPFLGSEYMKIIYVNCGWGNEYESDLRSNEHYLGNSDS